MFKHSWSSVFRFLSNLLHCSYLIRSPLKAYGYLRSGGTPEEADFNLDSFKFKGRKEDWLAIREVLINDEYACIKSILHKSDTPRVMDLGANIGSFAIRIFQHCPSATVVSVEAAPDTFQILETNKNWNPAYNWNVFNAGVWKDEGELTLMRRGFSMGHRVMNGGTGDVIKGITLDSLMNNLKWDSVDLIKMDIEGGEEEVVPQAVVVLSKTRFLIIELHNDRINAQPLIEQLDAIYKYRIQLNTRTSNKPLFLMANESLEMVR